ncbi:nucleotidyltransferase [Staphylococcus argensis]|uniref:tRNA(Met) cytidine acetate ligase n=1 Tax=Staphylococcus argensis TaxID=1607738 RepID=A0A2K4FEI8_9STAP|nr:nucleotidyltransferase [Staphylococcus argensis]MCY6992330.1 nucleotidyltransferase [Staphylococcus argensis]POA09731.1 nucleotidyltransferase [Staphylococcus argensis]
MKSVALITEYNPFHNGHQYHAQKAKKRTGADVSIAIMSGHFVMRGEPAIYSKFQRTRMALNDVDIVVELPLYGALSAGEYFARTGVKVADYMGASSLVFGAETAEPEQFHELARLLNSAQYQTQIREQLKKGKSYPRILNELFPHSAILAHPNNTLGLSYIRTIQDLGVAIEPFVLPRLQSHHRDHTIRDTYFASGTSIRNALMNADDQWRSVVPANLIPLYEQPTITWNDFYPYLNYAIMSQTSDELEEIYMVNEGLESRLQRMNQQTRDFEGLLSELKTKRYTRTYLQRMLLHVLLNTKKSDVNHEQPLQGVRILGMTQTGQRYLKQVKKRFPERQYVTNVNQRSAALFAPEIRGTQIYNLVSGCQEDDFNMPVIRKD